MNEPAFGLTDDDVLRLAEQARAIQREEDTGEERGSDDDGRSGSPRLKFSERFPAAMSGLRDRLIEKGVKL